MARIEQGLAGAGRREQRTGPRQARRSGRQRRGGGGGGRDTKRDTEEPAEVEAVGVGTEHDPADAERDAAIASVAGDPEALQALLQRFDDSVGSLLETRTAVAPTADSERQKDRGAERESGETVTVRMNGGWWRVPLSAPSPHPVSKTSKAAATGGSSFASRLESDLVARKDKATAVAASRARQAEKQQQLVLAPKVSKGRRRMGSASGVDALARPLEHRRC